MKNGPTVTIEERYAIEDLCTGVSRAIDELKLENLENWLSEDAVFNLGGHTLSGRETIISALSQRGAERKEATRHAWSNLAIEHVSADEVHTRGIMMVYSVVDENGTQTKSFRGGDFEDVLVRDGEGFRLKSRTMIVAFPF